MTLASPSRRVLAELSVNTMGTPSKTGDLNSETPKRKRPLLEVEDSEDARQVSRVKMSAFKIHDGVDKGKSPSLTDRPASISPHSHATSAVVDLESEHEPSEEAEEGNTQHSNKESISSVADFDPDSTMESQQTAATEVTQGVRSEMSLLAERMRVRLRLAHFKVRTNQIHVPFSQLQIPKRSTQLPSPPQGSPETPDQQPSLPKLLPAPILRPTAHSSRTIDQRHISSSPPSSPETLIGKPPQDANQNDAQDEGFRTPALPRESLQAVVQQTGSPPESSERKPTRRHHDDDDDDDLTSSAVRGKAAIGLLGLREERKL